MNGRMSHDPTEDGAGSALFPDASHAGRSGSLRDCPGVDRQRGTVHIAGSPTSSRSHPSGTSVSAVCIRKRSPSGCAVVGVGHPSVLSRQSYASCGNCRSVQRGTAPCRSRPGVRCRIEPPKLRHARKKRRYAPVTLNAQTAGRGERSAREVLGPVVMRSAWRDRGCTRSAKLLIGVERTHVTKP